MARIFYTTNLLKINLVFYYDILTVWDVSFIGLAMSSWGFFALTFQFSTDLYLMF